LADLVFISQKCQMATLYLGWLAGEQIELFAERQTGRKGIG